MDSEKSQVQTQDAPCRICSVIVALRTFQRLDQNFFAVPFTTEMRNESVRPERYHICRSLELHLWHDTSLEFKYWSLVSIFSIGVQFTMPLPTYLTSAKSQGIVWQKSNDAAVTYCQCSLTERKARVLKIRYTISCTSHNIYYMTRNLPDTTTARAVNTRQFSIRVWGCPGGQILILLVMTPRRLVGDSTREESAASSSARRFTTIQNMRAQYLHMQ
jgi:hypothetical protein